MVLDAMRRGRLFIYSDDMWPSRSRCERSRDLGVRLPRGVGQFGAEVETEEGRFGPFDVLLDGKLVASKGGFWRRVTIHGAPPQERLLASIEKHLAVRVGDVCEIEPAHQGQTSEQASTMKTLGLSFALVESRDIRW